MIEFKLDERPAGISLNFASKGDQCQVLGSELVYPMESNKLVTRLEQMQILVFGKIPSLPAPSQIDHLLVLIDQDLNCKAYINELSIHARMKINRDVKKGEPIYSSYIDDIDSVDLGVEIPTDNGVVVFRTHGWRRSLFFDFNPINSSNRKRSFSIEQVLATQALHLMGLESLIRDDDEIKVGKDRRTRMIEGYKALDELIKAKVTEESSYQELFYEHPWMFGGQYKSIDRHTNLDDENIPDFTAVRSHDNFRDIIEIKQPFLTCFKKGNKFSSGFNDSWNQAERYLNFVFNQRGYLKEEKDLFFENPRCILIIGDSFSDKQLKMIRDKESMNRSISVYTYDHIQRTSAHILNLLSTVEGGG